MPHWACAGAYATIAALGLAMNCRPVPLAGIPQTQQPISALLAGPANGEHKRRQPTSGLQAGPAIGGHQRQQEIKNQLMGIRLTLGNSALFMSPFWILLFLSASWGCHTTYYYHFYQGIYCSVNWNGVWHEIFDFRFFSWIIVPLAPKYSNGAVLNFLKIWGDIREWMFITGVNNTVGVRDCSSNGTSGRVWLRRPEISPICPDLQKEQTSVVNTVNRQWKIYRRCRWYRWTVNRQCERHRPELTKSLKFITGVKNTADKTVLPISTCLHLEMKNLRNSTFRCKVHPTKLLTKYQKNLKQPQWNTQGHWFMKKNLKSKISCHTSFRSRASLNWISYKKGCGIGIFAPIALNSIALS